MKGIILAGGSGTRLHPLTKVVSKQLLPVYDKPMIYYPLSVLISAGIKDVLIICTPKELTRFKNLLTDGSHIGMNFSYLVQPNPDGIAQAFIIGEEHIGNDSVCLILGDNIFYGLSMTNMLLKAISNAKLKNTATVFGYHVSNPERYGVVNLDQSGKALAIEEKPTKPKSNYAVTGIYFYPNDVIAKAKSIKPSSRGELEITTLTQLYLDERRLNIEIMHDEMTWLDAGTFKSLLEASNFIEAIEKRNGKKVACIEEISFEKGFIDKEQLISLASMHTNNSYGEYLLNCIDS